MVTVRTQVLALVCIGQYTVFLLVHSLRTVRKSTELTLCCDLPVYLKKGNVTAARALNGPDEAMLSSALAL